MSSSWSRSLQFRLAIRLALVYLIATLIALAVIAYKAFDVAAALNDRELRLRAGDLARSVIVDDGGAPRLAMSSKLTADYASPAGRDVFAIRTAEGHVLAAHPKSFGDRAATWPLASDEPSWFQLENESAGADDFLGLNIAVPSVAGPVSISVAQAGGQSVFVESVVTDFLLDAAWIAPLTFIVTLGAGVLVIRSGLAPMREASRIATRIGPTSTDIRLPRENLPKEIEPLVTAMNSALDRLDQGFALQRRFTANAAHELRTPLAILTAALDSMPPGEDVAKLRDDAARMNRLVEQLLRVARLDAIALKVSDTVDLNAAAASVVAAMAPLAVASRRPLALIEAEGSVEVKGNRHAIEDALRNLIENALAHSPEQAEISVRVDRSGSLIVSDQGPGVAVEDHERIFERFWRGSGAKATGAGLGLAIVREIMKAHGGRVSVGNNPGGGAVFSLVFAGAP